MIDFIGAGGRTRTDTSLLIPDFESGASTNSTTPAYIRELIKIRRAYLAYFAYLFQALKIRIFGDKNIWLFCVKNALLLTMTTRSLSTLLDDLRTHIQGESASVAQLIGAFHERGFGFFLFLIALPAALPVPAIGLNTIIALSLIHI